MAAYILSGTGNVSWRLVPLFVGFQITEAAVCGYVFKWFAGILAVYVHQWQQIVRFVSRLGCRDRATDVEGPIECTLVVIAMQDLPILMRHDDPITINHMHAFGFIVVLAQEIDCLFKSCLLADEFLLPFFDDLFADHGVMFLFQKPLQSFSNPFAATVSPFHVNSILETGIRLDFLVVNRQVLEIDHPKGRAQHYNLRKQIRQFFQVPDTKRVQSPKIRDLVPYQLRPNAKLHPK